MYQKQNDYGHQMVRAASNYIKNQMRKKALEVLKTAAKAGLKKLGIVFGLKAFVILFIIMVAITVVTAIFEGSAQGGNFTGDPDKESAVVNQELKNRYIETSDKTISQDTAPQIVKGHAYNVTVPSFNEQEKPYQLPWGILAALDKMANNCEDPIPDDNADILEPKFVYKDSEVYIKEVYEDSNGNLKTYITRKKVKLLSEVITYEGTYLLKYKKVTSHPNQNVTVTKEELVGSEFKRDLSRLKNRLDQLDLNPEEDFEFAMLLARTFHGEDPELELELDLEEAESLIGGGVTDVVIGEPSEYGFIWPIPGYTNITSDFGPRRAPVPGASTWHNGIDVAAPVGAAVVAAKEGTVVTAQYAGKAGNLLVIDHGNGIRTKYLHLDGFVTRVGDKVKAGQVVAHAGNTGIGTGAHLDFRIMIGGTYVNPVIYVNP